MTDERPVRGVLTGLAISVVAFWLPTLVLIWAVKR